MTREAYSQEPPQTSPAKERPPAPSRAGQFLRGVRLGTPIFLGYMPVGMAFGVIAASIGLSALQAVICSATALAGAGQFIALSVMRAGESAAAVLAATTVVNLRYVLFGATMSPYLKGLTLPKQAVLAFTLTDETFAVNINDHRERTATAWSMTGVGAIAWTGWIFGTAIGAIATAWIGDPTRWGVDFAMPAMFTALLIALAETRTHVIVAATAGVIALALPALSAFGVVVPTAWFIVISSMAAATLGTALFPDDGHHR